MGNERITRCVHKCWCYTENELQAIEIGKIMAKVTVSPSVECNIQETIKLNYMSSQAHQQRHIHSQYVKITMFRELKIAPG